MEFNLESTSFITCSFEIEDIMDVLRGKLKREPTLPEALSVIEEIDDDLMLKAMCAAGWDVIHATIDAIFNGKEG